MPLNSTDTLVSVHNSSAFCLDQLANMACVPHISIVVAQQLIALLVVVLITFTQLGSLAPFRSVPPALPSSLC